MQNRRWHQEPAGRPTGEAAQAPHLEYFQEISMTAIRANIQSSSTATPILTGRLGGLLSRLVNRWVAGMIARSERQAARIALRQLDDRELKDIGLRRSQIGDAVDDIACERTRRQQRGPTCQQ